MIHKTESEKLIIEIRLVKWDNEITDIKDKRKELKSIGLMEVFRQCAS